MFWNSYLKSSFKNLNWRHIEIRTVARRAMRTAVSSFLLRIIWMQVRANSRSFLNRGRLHVYERNDWNPGGYTCSVALFRWICMHNISLFFSTNNFIQGIITFFSCSLLCPCELAFSFEGPFAKVIHSRNRLLQARWQVQLDILRQCSGIRNKAGTYRHPAM